MYAEAQHNPVTHRDRLVTTLAFALLLHGMVILGVTFTAGEPDRRDGAHTLEVVLVNSPVHDPPDRPDYLAETAQRGSGNVDEQTRARSPEASSPGDPSARSTRTRGENPLDGALDERITDDFRRRQETAADSVVTTSRPHHVSFALNLRAGAGSATPTAHGTPLMLPTIPADTEAHSALAYSQDPPERVISVNTQEALYASYLHAWRERVERVGNLNYPDEARRQGLRGSLELEVALGSGGNVHELRVKSGSGHRVLDDAAMRIVYMASPFPPFPEELRREAQVLRFAFIWEFGDDAAKSSVRAQARGR